ncbi:hypothetical protein GPJ56_007070 [Histomonas meleagridis]|uniref:uncharacterized protein n=1 Tax=Histomonas meleagridis TaxID=135588 RepID=UPI00355937A3|nr:hypothetical protein GPJ56_007070 [Histomonas meleagridis]KAH0799783.1 hypothetical protein GO595_007504 [Histomonas meleagridis]
MLFRSTDIYTSEENSKALWKKIIEMLIPVNMRCNNHFPLIDSFNDPDGEMYVAYFSSDNIYLSTLKSQISSLCYFNGLQNDSGSYTISFVYKDNLIIDTFNTNKYEMWSDYTSKSVSSRNNVVQYICSSFSSIPSNVQLTPEFIDAYQKMILTHDMTFIIPFFQCILESPKSKELARSLCDIYSKNNSIFILFKMIAYFEISFFASTPTEIFRQNTVFTQLITDFFKLKLKKFIENGINVVKTEVSKRPLFDFDHPKEEDIQIIEELLDIFWRVMDSSISYIPKSILQFLRYLRMLCETKFGDENLNHRALIGVFLLRFIVPSFSSPENNMVNGTIDQNSFRRSIAFSKVIMSLSTLEMNYTRVGDRQFLNPIFEKHIPKMALFLQKISEVDEDEVMEDIDENRNVDIKDAINEIREFIRENRKEIEKRAEKVGSLPPLFLVEAMFSLFDTAVSE